MIALKSEDLPVLVFPAIHVSAKRAALSRSTLEASDFNSWVLNLKSVPNWDRASSFTISLQIWVAMALSFCALQLIPNAFASSSALLALSLLLVIALLVNSPLGACANASFFSALITLLTIVVDPVVLISA